MRLGWLRALNLQGSGGLAKLGPITAVVAAAFMGRHQPGTLMAIYLLAQRVFWRFDGLVDLRLDAQSVRGAVTRCFELIDLPAQPSKPATHLRSTTPEQPSLPQSTLTIETDLKPAFGQQQHLDPGQDRVAAPVLRPQRRCLPASAPAGRAAVTRVALSPRTVTG